MRQIPSCRVLQGDPTLVRELYQRACEEIEPICPAAAELPEEAESYTRI